LSKRWSLIAQDQALQCHQPVAARTRRVAPADPTADLGIDRHVRLHASTQRLRPRQDSTIVVTLPPEFEGLTAADQVMAIAQLVIPHQNSDAEQLGFYSQNGTSRLPSATDAWSRGPSRVRTIGEWRRHSPMLGTRSALAIHESRNRQPRLLAAASHDDGGIAVLPTLVPTF
jgi:hypothetical protein